MTSVFRAEGDDRFYTPQHSVVFLLPWALEMLTRMATDPDQDVLPGWMDRIKEEVGETRYMAAVLAITKTLMTLKEFGDQPTAVEVMRASTIPLDDRGFRFACEGLGRLFLTYYFVAARDILPMDQSEPLANTRVTQKVHRRAEEILKIFTQKQHEAKYGKQEEAGSGE